MPTCARSIACLVAIMWAGICSAEVILTVAQLTGAAENPANSSPGTGQALVVFDTTARTLRVRIDARGLSSPSTVAHVHCCVSPGGNVMPATTLPTLAGFPEKSTEPTMDQTYDTSMAATWNPAFVSANRTIEGAEEALRVGLKAGNAYINVHSDKYGDGEIRGFLSAVEKKVQTQQLAPGGAAFVDKAGVPVKILSTQEYTCNSTFERCVIPLYVSSFKVEDFTFCDGAVELGKIKVPTSDIVGKKIRIVWLLVERDVGDPHEYRFQPAQGIVFRSGNDVTKDFSDPDEETREPRRRYKWDSTHMRPRKLQYDPKVQLLTSTGPPVQCNVLDPTISNL